jgi:superfamily II DNA or RNA helicase
VDIAEVKCVVLARPTKSLALHIQQGARCMTPWKGVRPRILDVVGNSYRHGFAFEDRAWSLERRRRPGRGREEAHAKRCEGANGKRCGAMAPMNARVCSACGAVFPVIEVASPPTPTVEAKKLTEVRWSAAEVEKKREQLTSFATERGFKDASGWVSRVLEAMTGASPPT